MWMQLSAGRQHWPAMATPWKLAADNDDDPHEPPPAAAQRAAIVPKPAEVVARDASAAINRWAA